jgi:hypothetical protein
VDEETGSQVPGAQREPGRNGHDAYRTRPATRNAAASVFVLWWCGSPLSVVRNAQVVIGTK